MTWREQISPEAAKPHDSIQIRDSAGKMQQWFYTSSLSTAGAGAKAVPNGKHKVTIWSIPDRYVRSQTHSARLR
eukprot:1668881-Rhodomonas_salina.2